MRYFLTIFVVSVAAVVGILGLRGSHSRKPTLYIFPDMEWQMKLRPQKPEPFFANGRSSQLPVAGTIARATPIQIAGKAVYPFEDAPVNTGFVPGTTNFVDLSPLPATAELLKRGQQRFNINCAPCHGATGDGNGITKKLGMAAVANLHDKRIVELPDGEVFYVITTGRRNMSPYGDTVSVQDRWAIVAYLRVLQLAQLGTAEDLPMEKRAALPK